MKKFFFFASAVIAAGAMFTSCSEENPESCTCTIKVSYGGQSETETQVFDGEDLAEAFEEYGVNTCKDLGKKANAELEEDLDGSGMKGSVTCK